MNITEVRIRLKDNDDSKVKASASVTFDDCFVVHDIKVIDGPSGYFIAMPSRKLQDGTYIDVVHPLNNATRDAIKDAVIKAFTDADPNRRTY